MKNAGLLLLFCLCTMVIKAQFTDQLISDRPGQSISPNTVGAQTLQIQSRIMLLQSNFREVESDLSFMNNNTVIRLGISERFEVSGMLNYELNRSEEFGRDNIIETQGQTYNYHVSGRFNILNRSGLVPSIGVQTSLSRSTSDKGETFTDEAYFIITAANTLTGSGKKNQIGLFSNII